MKKCPTHGIRSRKDELTHGLCLKRDPILFCLTCFERVRDTDLRDDKTLIHRDCGGHCEQRTVICRCTLVEDDPEEAAEADPPLRQITPGLSLAFSPPLLPPRDADEEV